MEEPKVIIMPQINFYTYLSQTTWTIILFYVLYYYMKQYILPALYENIKIKNLGKNPESVSTVNTKDDNITTIYNNNISNIL